MQIYNISEFTSNNFNQFVFITFSGVDIKLMNLFSFGFQVFLVLTNNFFISIAGFSNIFQKIA